MRATIQEGLARARREKPEYRFCGRRPRRRHCREPAFFLRKPGTGLFVRLASLRRALRLQPFRRALHRVAEQINTGTVWVNCWLVRDLRVPFGGMKQSGVGREGGEEALRFFAEPKNVCIAK